jgi:esterase/lipase superfamily enzyme
LGQEVDVVRWGHKGQPVLLYPTAGGDAEECERFLMIDALGPLIGDGKVRVYAVDSIAGRCWIDKDTSPAHKSWLQRQFLSFVRHELVPAIRADCKTPEIPVWVAGASIGAFQSLLSICTFPDVFTYAICMSGTFDMARWMGGQHPADYHFASPLHFMAYMPESEQLSLLRKRFVLLPTGEGRWEAPWESWRVANMLGGKGVPNRVDLWSKDWHHDWVTWRAMLPKYLEELTRGG